ncbi:unnamed protein product [Macrosiphum euphorbiae]|uniref:Uncharacterized protein n=1 Tax=Macrosiphum euphorbiae TaxID=13131 RepID=A0AAV0XFI2_9HEMI|nr:unnamed protein product [Macrosiphum euphorbiae]
MPNIGVQTTFAGDASVIGLSLAALNDSPFADANSSGRVVKWPDRNCRGKLCQSKVPLLHFDSQHGHTMMPVAVEVKIETVCLPLHV